ncbi:MAG TPA: efflux RND transporter periplasmic adaptor subunit [Bacillota bacterium]|nr:efflux RND transporter periplasmic adaptor subunit [Bacillota bacterium]
MLKFIGSKYTWPIAIGVALILFLAGWSIFGNTRTKVVSEDIPVVKTEVVKLNSAGEGYKYSGEVRGRFESQLAFQVSGKITRRNVELGSVVQSGSVLMQIDPVDVQQSVAMAKAQLHAAQSQFKLAKDNLDRFKVLYDQKYMSQPEFNRYQNDYDLADAALRQAKAQFSQGSNQLKYCNLYADGAGVVAGVYAETGQVVAAGQPVVVLVKGSEREVEINLPENRLDNLTKGQRFQVTFWALPNVAVAGEVREVSPMADPVTRTYKVRISLLNPPSTLKLGMTATVAEAGTQSQSGVYIPLSAIYQTEHTPGVWMIQHGAVKLYHVKLGSFRDGDRVQVLAGIKAGDIIVTAGVHKLREGEKVRIGDDIY